MFRPLLPFDFNNDGRLGWEDLGALINNPELIRLLLP